MTFTEYYLIFPEGDVQAIPRPLQLGSLYDMHGNQLPIPLPTHKIIAYQITGKRTKEVPGFIQIFYQLEQLTAEELAAYI